MSKMCLLKSHRKKVQVWILCLVHVNVLFVWKRKPIEVWLSFLSNSSWLSHIQTKFNSWWIIVCGVAVRATYCIYIKSANKCLETIIMGPSNVVHIIKVMYCSQSCNFNLMLIMMVMFDKIANDAAQKETLWGECWVWLYKRNTLCLDEYKLDVRIFNAC